MPDNATGRPVARAMRLAGRLPRMWCLWLALVLSLVAAVPAQEPSPTPPAPTWTPGAPATKTPYTTSLPALSSSGDVRSQSPLAIEGPESPVATPASASGETLDGAATSTGGGSIGWSVVIVFVVAVGLLAAFRAAGTRREGKSVEDAPPPPNEL
jgi:hypothetical protein